MVGAENSAIYEKLNFQNDLLLFVDYAGTDTGANSK